MNPNITSSTITNMSDPKCVAVHKSLLREDAF